MITTNLSNLELQIEALLDSREQLQSDNGSLRGKLSKLTQQRAELQDKNTKAASNIKRILSQLRTELP